MSELRQFPDERGAKARLTSFAGSAGALVPRVRQLGPGAQVLSDLAHHLGDKSLGTRKPEVAPCDLLSLENEVVSGGAWSGAVELRHAHARLKCPGVGVNVNFTVQRDAEHGEARLLLLADDGHLSSGIPVGVLANEQRHCIEPEASARRELVEL